MKSFFGGLLLLIVAAAAAAALFSAFIVDQTHKAIVLQFGEPVQVIDEPRLYWRKPFLQTVEQFPLKISHTTHLSRARIFSTSSARARCRRDRMVPSAQPRISAASS